MIEVSGFVLDVDSRGWLVGRAGQEERLRYNRLDLALGAILDRMLRKEFHTAQDFERTVYLIVVMYESLSAKVAEEICERLNAAAALEGISGAEA